jgi:hypothetical protein
VPDLLSVALVAEDDLSMAVLDRIVAASERPIEVSRRLVERGFGNIKRSVAKYRQASHVIPHVVLTDLDRAECPAGLRADWGAAELPPSMLFRVAVRETESWLLGDRHGFAEFAAVALNKVPQHPESLQDPKETLIGLVRRSRKRRLIDELVPAHGSSVSIGPLYNERLGVFAAHSWDIDAASAACVSLRRTRQRLAGFLA